MTPAQLFGVAVRTIGVLVVLASTWPFLAAILVPGGSLTFATSVLLVGLGLMRWPNWLVAFAYPEERRLYLLAADKQSPAS
jgi:hypothetical protein